MRDLVEQGIGVFLLDDASTDDTVEVFREAAGSHLVGVERLAQSDPPCFSLRRIIERKQALARELESTWFINADADEFREGPWGHLDLLESIRLVDRLGFNAVDFEVLNFWPTTASAPDGDPRTALPFFERSGDFNKLQIRCWKKLAGPLDLVSSGGHEAVFPGREVFPIRFILRHYPFRNQEQGRRKLFSERRPRYAATELDQGWHLQHRDLGDAASFVRDAAELTRYDPDVVRVELALRHREVERLEASPEVRRLEQDSLIRERELLSVELDRRNRQLLAVEAELAKLMTRRQRLARRGRGAMRALWSRLAGRRSGAERG